MRKKIFKTIAIKIEDRLRSLVGQINADQRIIITVVSLLSLSIGSIYMTVCISRHWGSSLEELIIMLVNSSI